MRTRILGGGFEGGAAFLQEAGEVLAGEAPLEGRCDSLPVVLKVEKALGECVEGGEIIGGEDFSLDDREVDFDLVEPAGMNGTVDQDQARILLLEALNGGETAMRRAVVDDPEHAARVVIGGAGHDLLDEAVEGGLAAAVLTTTEDAGPMHIERRQVGPGATSGVFMFDLHRRAGLSRDSGMPSSPGLHTGFLIGRDHEFVIAERFRVPDALVEIQYPSGLDGKIRIARKDPTAVAPRADRIRMEPTPDRAIADPGDESGLPDLHSKVGHAPTRQRETMSGRQFTSQRFNLNDQLWGEKTGGVPAVIAPPDRRGVLQRTACATCSRLRGVCPGVRKSRHWTGRRQRGESSLHAAPESTATYSERPAVSTPGPRLSTA